MSPARMLPRLALAPRLVTLLLALVATLLPVPCPAPHRAAPPGRPIHDPRPAGACS
jgi:hypothetical protein